MPKSDSTTNNPLETGPAEPSSLSGISNLESAIATTFIPSESEPSLIEIEVKTASNLQQQNTSHKSKAQSTKPKPIPKEETEDNWQPDLSGWDVSYGLPK